MGNVRSEILNKRRAEWDGKAKEFEKKQKESNNYSGSQIVYTDLKKGAYNLFRFIGWDYPSSYDEMKEAFSPVIVDEVFIKNEKGKWLRILTKPHSFNPVKQMFYALTEHEKSTDGKTKIYKYSDHAYFKLVTKNGSDAIKGDTSWLPKKMVVFNVLDRSRMEEHKKLGHTFLLTKDLKEVTKEVNGISQTNLYSSGSGIPFGIFTKSLVLDEETNNPIKNWTLEEVAREHGLYTDYDIVLWRKKYDPSQKMNFKTIWYKSMYPSNEIIERIPVSQKANWDLSKITTHYEDDAFLCDLAKYNLQKLFKPTSMKKIKEFLGGMVEDVDRDFDLNIMEKLDEAIEREENESIELISDSFFVNDFNEPVKIIKSKISKKEVAEVKVDSTSFSPTKKRTRKKEEPKKDLKSMKELLKLNGYDHVENLSDMNIKDIDSINADGSLNFVNAIKEEDLIDCECGLPTPESWIIGCPKCGVKFEVDADEPF